MDVGGGARDVHITMFFLKPDYLHIWKQFFYKGCSKSFEPKILNGIRTVKEYIYLNFSEILLIIYRGQFFDSP